MSDAVAPTFAALAARHQGRGPDLLVAARVLAQSPDHDQRAPRANERGSVGDQTETAVASRRSVALGARERSVVRGFPDRLWLTLQVQQYHPGRATERVLPSTRKTVTIVSGCMQPPQVVHFIGQTPFWSQPKDSSGEPSNKSRTFCTPEAGLRVTEGRECPAPQPPPPVCAPAPPGYGPAPSEPLWEDLA